MLTVTSGNIIRRDGFGKLSRSVAVTAAFQIRRSFAPARSMASSMGVMVLDKKNSKGQRIKISALAASLAKGSSGSEGICGIFEADHGAAMIIGSIVKGKLARRLNEQQKSAANSICAAIKGQQQRRHYSAQRAAAAAVQRLVRRHLSRKQQQQHRCHVAWLERMCGCVETFLRACEEHDIEKLKALCTDNISMQVELPAVSFAASGVSAVANRVRQGNVSSVIKKPHVVREQYDAASDSGTATVAREVLVGKRYVPHLPPDHPASQPFPATPPDSTATCHPARYVVNEEYELSPGLKGGTRICRHRHVFVKGEEEAASGGGGDAAAAAGGGAAGGAEQGRSGRSSRLSNASLGEAARSPGSSSPRHPRASSRLFTLVRLRWTSLRR